MAQVTSPRVASSTRCARTWRATVPATSSCCSHAFSGGSAARTAPRAVLAATCGQRQRAGRPVGRGLGSQCEVVLGDRVARAFPCCSVVVDRQHILDDAMAAVLQSDLVAGGKAVKRRSRSTPPARLPTLVLRCFPAPKPSLSLQGTRGAVRRRPSVSACVRTPAEKGSSSAVGGRRRWTSGSALRKNPPAAGVGSSRRAPRFLG